MNNEISVGNGVVVGTLYIYCIIPGSVSLVFLTALVEVYLYVTIIFRPLGFEFTSRLLVLVCSENNPSSICGALRNLVAFVQLKKLEKHPWRSVKQFVEEF